MKAILKRFPFFAKIEIRKLKHAPGICSKVKGTRNSHYLLFDCDGYFDFSYFQDRYPKSNIVSYATAHGHHVIVFESFSFNDCVHELLTCPFADRVHIALGIRRGYWFLETPNPIPTFEGNEETYMVIER